MSYLENSVELQTLTSSQLFSNLAKKMYGLEATKIALEQLKTKENVIEAMDKKEAKSPKAAIKEHISLKLSNEDLEAQDKKITKKANIYLALGTIFWVFFGIAAIYLVAYCAYSDGRQNGIEITKKNAGKIFMVRAKIEVVGDEKVFDSDYFKIAPSEKSEIEVLRDIMAIVRKYEEECKSPKISDYMGAFYVTNACLKKLIEKNYLVQSFPNTPIFLQL